MWLSRNGEISNLARAAAHAFMTWVASRSSVRNAIPSCRRARPNAERVRAPPRPEDKAAALKATVKKVAADDDEDDEDGIEDPSVLGGDDEDVAEVIALAVTPRIEET